MSRLSIANTGQNKTHVKVKPSLTGLMISAAQSFRRGFMSHLAIAKCRAKLKPSEG